MTEAAQIHARQLAYWNGEGAARWLANNRSHEDTTRTAFADHALDRAAIRPGERVIEIGCGTGETSARIAEKVGPSGAVLALDVSALIGAEAKARLASFPNATAVVADAAAYPFEPGAADLVFSQFGGLFFGDPAAAFANLRTALKPEGRLHFICWRAPRPDVAMETVLRVIGAPASTAYSPGPQSLSDPDLISAVLTEAGFAAPRFEGLEGERDISRGRGVEGAVAATIETGPVYRRLSGQPEPVRTAAAEALGAYFATVERGGKVIQPVSAWIVTATPKRG